MWGEFEDDGWKGKSKRQSDTETPDTKPQEIQKPEVLVTLDSLFELPLRDRIIHHIAASKLILKSQQISEPYFTYDERKAIVEELIDAKPGHFLRRFGEHLEREHLVYFQKYEGDDLVDHYLKETLKLKNEHTRRITVRNRRYAALQKLQRSGNYFSEKEMERRNPLLYDQLIGKHQTEEERMEKHKIDKSDLKLSTILWDLFDKCDEKDLKKLQEDKESAVLEELDTDDEEEVENPVESREKQLFKEEFYSAAYTDFLRGNDRDVDYGQIEIQERAEEERYFDDDDDDCTEDCNLQNDYNMAVDE